MHYVENFNDEECFKWAILYGIIHEKTKEDPTIKILRIYKESVN